MKENNDMVRIMEDVLRATGVTLPLERIKKVLSEGPVMPDDMIANILIAQIEAPKEK